MGDRETIISKVGNVEKKLGTTGLHQACANQPAKFINLWESHRQILQIFLIPKK